MTWILLYFILEWIDFLFLFFKNSCFKHIKNIKIILSSLSTNSTFNLWGYWSIYWPFYSMSIWYRNVYFYQEKLWHQRKQTSCPKNNFLEFKGNSPSSSPPFFRMSKSELLNQQMVIVKEFSKFKTLRTLGNFTEKPHLALGSSLYFRIN